MSRNQFTTYAFGYQVSDDSRLSVLKGFKFEILIINEVSFHICRHCIGAEMAIFSMKRPANSDIDYPIKQGLRDETLSK